MKNIQRVQDRQSNSKRLYDEYRSATYNEVTNHIKTIAKTAFPLFILGLVHRYNINQSTTTFKKRLTLIPAFNTAALITLKSLVKAVCLLTFFYFKPKSKNFTDRILRPLLFKSSAMYTLFCASKPLIKPFSKVFDTNPERFFLLSDKSIIGKSKEMLIKIVFKVSILALETLVVYHIFEEIHNLTRRLLQDRELAEWLMLQDMPDTSKFCIYKKIRDVIHLQSSSLCLSKLELSTIPPIIYKLDNLETLNLSENKLTALSAEIFTLPKLRNLYLYSNNISTIEPISSQKEGETFFELFSQKKIQSFTINPNPIHGNLLDYMANFFSANPAQKSSFYTSLEYRFLLNPAAFFYYYDIQTSEDPDIVKKREILIDWFQRLSETPEYQSSEDLMPLVTAILLEITEDKDFAFDFFSFVEANNEKCSDRAGMAFNLVYTLFELQNAKKEKNKQLKVNLLLRAAKTLAFRSYIATWIEKAIPDFDEHTQLFIHYETRLAQRLNLLSTIKNYQNIEYTQEILGNISRRGKSLDEDLLVREIEKNYTDYILEINQLEKVIEASSSFQEKWQVRAQFYDQVLEKILSSDSNPNTSFDENISTRPISDNDTCDERILKYKALAKKLVETTPQSRGEDYETSILVQKERKREKLQIAKTWLKTEGYLP